MTICSVYTVNSMVDGNYSGLRECDCPASPVCKSLHLFYGVLILKSIYGRCQGRYICIESGDRFFQSCHSLVKTCQLILDICVIIRRTSSRHCGNQAGHDQGFEYLFHIVDFIFTCLPILFPFVVAGRSIIPTIEHTFIHEFTRFMTGIFHEIH